MTFDTNTDTIADTIYIEVNPMKKTLWILLPLLAVLLIIAVTACVLFVKLAPDGHGEGSTAQKEDILSYVQEQWQLTDNEYADGVLTVRKSFDITYEQACKLGGNIFTEDLSPESYLSLVATLAGDLETKFENAPKLVLLCYCSSDGQTIFSVSSRGEITTCWQ